MEYQFSFPNLLVGLFIIFIGILFINWYKQISNFFGLGVSGYDRFKFAALIVCIIGVLVALNLHIYVFRLIVKIFIP